MAAAAQEVGVHPRTISRWFKEEGFAHEYSRQMNELQLELWHRMLAVKDEAWARFLELMRGTDDRISLRAVSWYLERLLSVPAIIAKNGLVERGTESDLSPRTRALLDQAEAIERGEGDSHED